MQVLRYNIEKYCAAERDLCSLHAVPEEYEGINEEYETAKRLFAQAFGNLKDGIDYELPDWHHNIRMLWVYVYSDSFYCPQFVGCIKQLLRDMPHEWFAQFECYSPARESAGLPTGWVGDFLIYKDTAMFCESDGWNDYRSKLGIP